MAPTIHFPPFRLDLADERLWRDDQPIELRPKTYAVLAHLVGCAPSLASHQELLSSGWGDVEVSVGTLNQSILELRRALGDDARDPRFIETVHRRGFRFVAPVETERVDVAQLQALAPAGGDLLVGRESELDQLEASLQAARAGHRQLVFVTGEPGIGKTSLVRSFLRGLEQQDRDEALWIGVGHCVELHGESEAYLPVLDALGRLAREAGGAHLRAILTRFAPSWLAQLPWLDVAGDAGEQPQHASQQLTPTRMLRELCVALEELTRERTLVLWLEDLHWCDFATLDLLAALARRRDPARLLVLASYRPVDAAVAGHPVAALKRSLVQRGEGRELMLELLEEPAVAAYLRVRFDWEHAPPHLTRVIHAHSEGNPLFMVTLSDRLVAEIEGLRAGTDEALETAAEFLLAVGADTLGELVEAQIAVMNPEDVEVLEAASVAGTTFAAQSVAAALGVEELSIEKVCSRLAGWQLFLSDAGTGRWPDGSAAERYAFLHDVFRRILYERIPAARRQQLHRRVAERLAAGYASEADAVAGELAVHFERGGDAVRAVDWLERAAGGVRRRFADREAVVYLDRALALLAQQPESDARSRRELDLRLELGEALMYAAGLASDASEANLQRALEIASDLDDPAATATVLCALARASWFRADLAAAQAWMDRFFALESRVESDALGAFGHGNAAMIAAMKGDLPSTLREAETAWQLIAQEEHLAVPFVTKEPAVQALAARAVAEWLGGNPARADDWSRQAVERARRADAFRLFASLLFRGELARHLRSIDEVDRVSLELERLQEEYGFGLAFAHEPAREAWRLLQHGDSDAALARIEAGLSTAHTSKLRMLTSLLLATRAEVRLARGEAQAGLAAIEDALAFVEETGERYLEAELFRLRGELLLLEPRIDAATQAFQRALAIARCQGARALELRAATSLARVWQREGRKHEARELLAPVYAAFTEGFDTTDLVDAKALLDVL